MERYRGTDQINSNEFAIGSGGIESHPQEAVVFGAAELRTPDASYDVIDLVSTFVRNPELVKDSGMKELGLEATLKINEAILRFSRVPEEEIQREENKIRESIMTRNGIMKFMEDRLTIYMGIQETLEQRSGFTPANSNPESSIEA